MSADGIEQRANFRPPTPKPGLSARLDIAMEMLAKKKQWNVVAHSTLIGFTLLCIAIVWWSVHFRLPQIQQDNSAVRQLNQVRNQIEQLRLSGKVSPDPEMLKHIQEHELELFADKKSVVAWLKQQIGLAREQGIALHYVLGATHPALVRHHALDITLQLRVSRATTQSAYSRLIRFAKGLENGGVKIHLDQATMRGSGRGVTTMEMHVKTWMR